MADIKFTPPSNSNNAVMVDDNNQLRNPTAEQFLQSNPDFAKASDLTKYSATTDSLEKKTQNMSSSVGKTTFSGSISSGSISSNNINVSGDLNVEGTLKASNIGNLIGKSLSVENLTVTDTLTAKNFEIDIPDTILNVEGIKSKGIIEANDFQETYPNKFVKGWFLARVENSENEGNKNIYISNKQYSYAEITSAKLPSDFETADFSNISVNDVFYFYNSIHFPYAFRVISIYENYLEVKEIDAGSLTIYDSDLSSFRYGLFIIGKWDNLNNSVIFSPAKIDAGYANFYNNILAIGDDNSLGYNSCSTGTSCSSIGMYSSCIGRGNVAISYSSTAFGQNNFVLGEKCSAIGANNNIEGGNSNVAFGYDNRIYSSNVRTTISGSSVALGQGIKIDATVNPKISLGKYNLDDDNIIFSVGNGTSDNNRSNAFEVYRDGDINSPTIEYLKTGKVNSGVLHFNKGTLICENNIWSTDSAFSYVFTFAMSQDDWANMKGMYRGYWVNTADYSGNQCGVWFGDVGNRLVVRLAYKKSDGTFGSKDISVANSTQWSPYLDNKPHIICASFSNELFKLRIDGKEIGSVSVTDFTPSENSQYFTVRSYGKVSDVALFNFDITADDAPYSINDYQQGKPIPPYLLMGNNGERFNIVNAVEDTDWEIDTLNCSTSLKNENGVYTIYKYDKVEEQTNYQAYFFMRLSSTIKAGSLVKVNLKRSGGTQAYKLIFTKEYKAKTEQASFRLLNDSWDGDVLKNDILVLPVDCNGAYIQLTPTIDEFSFEELSIEVNGAELALENFTFGEVLDYSGNGRHGTITGSVKGDNDTKVETLFEKFSARISNQTNG